MTILQSILLGIVQGLTEFLPISSDGHLVLTQHLLNLSQASAAFDIFLHTATLVAVIIFFGSQIIKLNRHYLLNILWTTLPTGLIGLFFNRYIDTLFTSLYLTSAGFLVTSIFLFLSRKRIKNTHPSITPTKAIIIGIVQGFAVLPGWSRSGSTIATSLILGIPPQVAFSFSFIAAIPAIVGAQVLQLDNLLSHTNLPLLVYVGGFAASAIVGFMALAMLRRVVVGHKFHLFAFYTLPLAIITFLLALTS